MSIDAVKICSISKVIIFWGESIIQFAIENLHVKQTKLNSNHLGNYKKTPFYNNKYKWNVNVYNIWQSLWWKRNDCWYRNSESDALLSAFPFSISYQMVWAPLVFYHWMNEGQGTHLLLHMHIGRMKRPFLAGKCHFHIISFDWKHQRCQTDMIEDTFGK